ncbi:hypothetical protein NDU88_003632 [Pleurodeles waltl]|uniref:Uncharacterized protein n=1 Tax=Pleurodeles waltl TaxID=8319 RepID=A0AAV7QA93_PLEWA|nr:hypothetical protein NDU88_003632 [Pleurodeles waltl]
MSGKKVRDDYAGKQGSHWEKLTKVGITAMEDDVDVLRKSSADKQGTGGRQTGLGKGHCKEMRDGDRLPTCTQDRWSVLVGEDWAGTAAAWPNLPAFVCSPSLPAPAASRHQLRLCRDARSNRGNPRRPPRACVLTVRFPGPPKPKPGSRSLPGTPSGRGRDRVCPFLTAGRRLLIPCPAPAHRSYSGSLPAQTRPGRLRVRRAHPARS